VERCELVRISEDAEKKQKKERASTGLATDKTQGLVNDTMDSTKDMVVRAIGGKNDRGSAKSERRD